MLIDTIIAFFTNSLHLSVLIAFWAFALISFLYWRENGKTRWLYVHLAFLLVPLLDFAIAVPCQIPFIQGLLSFCSVIITRTVIFAIPIALLLAVVLGYHAAPIMYKRVHRAKEVSSERFQKLARTAGLSRIRFWALDTAKPIAFSFGRNVLMSVGMFELLDRKEQDAVLLHELGHVKNKSSIAKFSTALARFFSPVAYFASVSERVNAEERSADAFAARIQGTAKYLNAAKRKIDAFNRL